MSARIPDSPSAHAFLASARPALDVQIARARHEANQS
jgi:hypothetical protein